MLNRTIREYSSEIVYLIFALVFLVAGYDSYLNGVVFTLIVFSVGSLICLFFLATGLYIRGTKSRSQT